MLCTAAGIPGQSLFISPLLIEIILRVYKVCVPDLKEGELVESINNVRLSIVSVSTGVHLGCRLTYCCANHPGLPPTLMVPRWFLAVLCSVVQRHFLPLIFWLSLKPLPLHLKHFLEFNSLELVSCDVIISPAPQCRGCILQCVWFQQSMKRSPWHGSAWGLLP